MTTSGLAPVPSFACRTQTKWSDSSVHELKPIEAGCEDQAVSSQIRAHKIHSIGHGSGDTHKDADRCEVQRLGELDG